MSPGTGTAVEVRVWDEREKVRDVWMGRCVDAWICGWVDVWMVGELTVGE